jgi:hypothetical protein
MLFVSRRLRALEKHGRGLRELDFSPIWYFQEW